MKKTVSFLLVLAIFFSMAVTPALADVTFYWGNGNSVSYPARFSTSGDSEESSIFFVESNGNAKIGLWQNKGTCQLLSYTKLFSGFGGTAEEWGKYEITVCYEDGTKSYYQWDNTYFGDAYTIKLKNAGRYYIYVRPYTNSQMTDSYLLDQFAGWTSPANWWIDSKINCSVTTSSPFSSSSSSSSSSNQSQSKPQYAEVQIIHRLQNGTVLNKTCIQAGLGSQYFSPYWSNSNYELTSEYNVKYNVTSGTNIVYFTYREKNNSSSSSNNNSSSNNSSSNHSSNNNSSSNTYDPDNPFLYGIEEYEYCLAPEYIIDPTQKPWNYCYLYSEASDINGRNMGKYNKDEVVKVIEYYGGNHGKFNYCYVITKDNKLGYMHDYALRPVDEGF